MQLKETEERRKEFAIKNKKNNNNNNGMAHCSFQERKIIMVITRNLPYPSHSFHGLLKKSKKKGEIAHLSRFPCYRINLEIKKYTH